MKNKDFLRAFSYTWPLYVILPIIGGFAVSYLFSIHNQPKAYQKVSVFLASSSVEKTGLTSAIKKSVNETELRQVSLIQSDPDDGIFAQKLSVVGYESADLFILPYSVISGLTLSDTMLPFTDKFKTDYILPLLTSPVYYEQSSVAFGLKIKSQGTASKLEAYMNFKDEDYYLTFSAKSYGIGNYGLYDNPDYDLALKTAEYFIGA